MSDQFSDERCAYHGKDDFYCSKRALIDSRYCFAHDKEVSAAAGTPRPA